LSTRDSVCCNAETDKEDCRVRIEEIIGQRMLERRTALKLTQETLAERITVHLNREWTRQAVSAAEKGKRSFTASELVAIAHSIGTTVTWLMSPPEGTEGVELGDGAYLPAHMLVSALIPQITGGQSLSGVLDAVYQLQLHTGDLGKAAGVIDADISALARQIAAVAAPYIALEPDGITPSQPVVAAIVTSQKGVLITRRKDGSPPWGFVSGEVEPGESPADAAVREVKEETGLEVRVGQVIGERVHPQTGRMMIYLAAEPVRGTEAFIGDEAELAEVKWASVSEAGELLPDMFGPAYYYIEHVLGQHGRPS
jgi:8-oxo-dGTP pyrophosphatase MutT (NUDIX family)/transcriptional regulator with XRE-family HTH domain